MPGPGPSLGGEAGIERRPGLGIVFLHFCLDAIDGGRERALKNGKGSADPLISFCLFFGRHQASLISLLPLPQEIGVLKAILADAKLL